MKNGYSVIHKCCRVKHSKKNCEILKKNITVRAICFPNKSFTNIICFGRFYIILEFQCMN